MRPELLTTPRSQPLEIAIVGQSSDIRSAVLRHLEALKVNAGGRDLVPMFEVLERAAFGRLRYGRDVKVIKATLPSLIFELRFTLAASGNVVQGRVFCAERPPSRILLLGFFFKLAEADPEINRSRQSQAALAAQIESERH